MKRSFFIPLIVLFLAFGLIACGQEEPEEAPVDVDSIALDTGLGDVTAEGRIIPPASVNLAFQASGTVVEVAVAAGDTVNKGDVLIRLDDSDQQIAKQQAEVGLVQAQANVKTAEAGVATAQAALETAQVGIQAAQAQLDILQAGPTSE